MHDGDPSIYSQRQHSGNHSWDLTNEQSPERPETSFSGVTDRPQERRERQVGLRVESSQLLVTFPYQQLSKRVHQDRLRKHGQAEL